MSDVTVLKIGGSVLTGHHGYATAAAFLAARLQGTGDRFVVVVSAEYGHTDELYQEARAIAAAGLAPDDHVTPDPALLDLLWSTGETRSVALLSLRLRALGASATGIAVHQIGLTVVPGQERIAFNPLSLRAALAVHRVVVVPGFLAVSAHRVVTLGRGGSDWSAVLLAARLGAARCELIKDVDGYFTADPNTTTDAQLISHLSYTTALQMADDGCPLVQRHAIAEAARARLPLVIRSLSSQGTLVSERLSVAADL
jgi:aspartate kinase